MILSNLGKDKSNTQSHGALGTTEELPIIFDIFQLIVFSCVECKQAYRWNKGKEMQVVKIKYLTQNVVKQSVNKTINTARTTP
jgi:hypothetical protein